MDYINGLDTYYADGHSAHAVQTAAVEYGLGMIGRAFWYAMVEPALPVLTPNVMGMLGRQTVGTGNSVWRITAGGAGLRLTPVSAWEISGGVEEDTWAYRMELERPSGDAFVRLSGYQGVVHVRYMPRPTAPWAGVSPLTAAGLTAQQLGYIERSLRDDVELPTGAIMPLPDGVNQAVVTKAGTVLSSGRGATSLLETTAAGFGQGMHAAPKQDWMQRRFGPEPPATAIDLRESSALWILDALGVPATLHTSAGAAQREAYRHFFTATIEPLGRLIAYELSEKFERTITITFPEAVKSDIAAKARAFNSLIQAGVKSSDAAKVVGFPPLSMEPVEPPQPPTAPAAPTPNGVARGLTRVVS